MIRLCSYLCMYCLAVASLLLTTGCSSRSYTTIKPTECSKLAGNWYSSPPGCETDIPENPNNIQSPSVIIRDDGSFDWTQTMMLLYGDIRQLRKPGDSIRCMVPPDTKLPDTKLTVKEAEYTPTSSRITLEMYHCQDNQSGLIYYSAKLNEDGNLSYKMRMVAPDTPPEGKERQELLFRNPEWDLKRMCTNWRLEEQDIETRKIDTPSGGSNIILHPKEAKTQIPLVVLLQNTQPDMIGEEAIRKWSRQAARNRVIILIPELLATQGTAKPERKDIQRDAESVGTFLTETLHLSAYTDAYLIGMDNGGLVGHWIWQNDNRAYTGFLLYDANFKEYTSRTPGCVNKDRPICFITSKKNDDNLESQNIQPAQWYREQGFSRVTDGFEDFNKGNIGDAYFADFVQTTRRGVPGPASKAN